MSKLTLVTIASLITTKAADLAKDCAADFETGRIAYLNGAKRLIALTKLVGATKAAEMLRGRGVSDSTLKNARQLVRVYDALVATELVTEEWFNDVLFLDAVAINSALAKKSVKDLDYVWRKSVKGAAVECQLIAETGMTHSERESFAERQQKKADAAKATVGVGVTAEGADSTPGTPAPLVELPAAGEAPGKGEVVATGAAKGKDAGTAATVAAKPPVNPMAEFESAADTLEQLIAAVLAKSSDEVTADRIRVRLVAINRFTEETVKVKTKGRKSVAA